MVQKTGEFAEKFRFGDDNLLVLSHRNVDGGVDVVDIFGPFNLGCRSKALLLDSLCCDFIRNLRSCSNESNGPHLSIAAERLVA